MGYSSGFLKDIVTIKNKVVAKGFGETTGYEPVAQVHANVTWSKGVKKLQQGSLDAIDVVMIRMRWNNIVTRESRLECNGVTYQILSFHADKQENQIEITAQEIVK